MSQILFQGNNLVITGELWEKYGLMKYGEKVSKEDNLQNLHLTFIVQVNGKMIIHQEPLGLDNWKPVDWNVWYTLVRVFYSFWYTFSEDRVTQESMILEKWIEQLQKSNSL